MIRRPHGNRGRDDESGFTLLEVMIGMVIMAIFMAIFGNSIVTMFRGVDRTQETAFAQSKVNQAFLRLEKQIRYAGGISLPASNVFKTGDSVVEFVTEYSGSTQCTQLRLDEKGTLRQRTWDQAVNGAISNVAYTTIAADLTAEDPTADASSTVVVSGPFARMAATGASNNQRLEIAVSAVDEGYGARKRNIDVTFSALNTGTSTESTSVCSSGRAGSFTWPSV